MQRNYLFTYLGIHGIKKQGAPKDTLKENLLMADVKSNADHLDSRPTTGPLTDCRFHLGLLKARLFQSSR